MKLRIQGDSLRLRLTQKEVAQLRAGSPVEASIHFASGRCLTYALATSADAAQVSADFDGACIRVTLPFRTMAEWADSSQVTIAGPENEPTALLIEKDFQCMHKPGEPDPDAYPNPLAAVLNAAR